MSDTEFCRSCTGTGEQLRVDYMHRGDPVYALVNCDRCGGFGFRIPGLRSRSEKSLKNFPTAERSPMEAAIAAVESSDFVLDLKKKENQT